MTYAHRPHSASSSCQLRHNGSGAGALASKFTHRAQSFCALRWLGSQNGFRSIWVLWCNAHGPHWPCSGPEMAIVKRGVWVSLLHTTRYRSTVPYRDTSQALSMLRFSAASVLKSSDEFKAQWSIGYGVGLRIKRSSVRIRPWLLRWVLGQGS